MGAKAMDSPARTRSSFGKMTAVTLALAMLAGVFTGGYQSGYFDGWSEAYGEIGHTYNAAYRDGYSDGVRTATENLQASEVASAKKPSTDEPF